MGELPRTVTPLAANVATALMVTALRDREAKPEPVAQHLLSLVWIETGRGRSCIQNNLGNLAGSYQGNFWRPAWYRVDESSSPRLRALHERMLAGKAPSQFRAYPSRGEGLDDFVALLYQPRYRPMLQAARASDTEAFANAVYETGYCPDEGCRGANTISSYRSLTDSFAPLLGLPKRFGNGGGKWSGLVALLVIWALGKGRL